VAFSLGIASVVVRVADSSLEDSLVGKRKSLPIYFTDNTKKKFAE
jgi:hypothetical protein